jgi:hypothetical protein
LEKALEKEGGTMPTETNDSTNHEQHTDQLDGDLLSLSDEAAGIMTELMTGEGADALMSILENASLREALHRALRTAFADGGLACVDTMLDRINAQLRRAASHFELSEGAALSHDAEGYPEALIVTFCQAGIDRPLLVEHIDLR